MRFLEGWFSDELLPVLFKYRKKGAINIPDYIKAARKDRNDKIVAYLMDIDAKEWLDVKKYLNVMDEAVAEKMATVKVTKGMANALGSKTPKYKCGSCAMAIPAYKGRYPGTCPNCSNELSGGDVEDIAVNKARNVNVSKGMANSSKSVKYTCNDCELKIPVYKGKYPSKCPACGGGFDTIVDKKDTDAKMDDFSIEIQELIQKAQSVFGERSDVDFLGKVGNVIYLYIDGKKKGFRIKPGKDIDAVIKKVKELVGKKPDDALKYLDKNTDLKEQAIRYALQFPVVNTEERVARNRVLDYYPEAKATTDFWGTKEGKAAKKQIDTYLKEHVDEDEEDVDRKVSVYNETLLVVNSHELLWDVAYADVQEETDAVALSIYGTVKEDKLTHLVIDLQNVNNDAFMVNEKRKDDENYIMVVY